MTLHNSIGKIDTLKNFNLPDRPRNERGWVMFLGDFIAIALSWYIANKIYFAFQIHTTFVGPNRIPVIEIFSNERAVVFASFLLLFRQMGHYKDRIHYFFQLRSIFVASCLGIIAESVLRLYLETPTSTTTIIIAWTLVCVAVMSLRVATAIFVCSRSNFLQPAIVLSDGSLGRHTKKAIGRKIRLGYRLADQDMTKDNPDWSDLTRKAIEEKDELALERLKDHATNSAPNTLFLYAFDTFNEESVGRAIECLEQLKRPFGFITCRTGIRLPSFKEFQFFGEDIILLLADQKDRSLLSRSVKRFFDITLAIILFLIFAPLLLTFSLLISRDGGPVVFSHPRVGRRGESFNCLKFRSMVVDADQKLNDYLASDKQANIEWLETHKLKVDPRITRFGSFLRKSSLDEIAQLYNILKGDMSFVGPRPIVEQEIEKYGPSYSRYCEVRPGITGLWQVSGRNNTTYEERVELDKWYVENQSLSLDLFILAKTFPIVLLRRGAY